VEPERHGVNDRPQRAVGGVGRIEVLGEVL